MIAMNLVLICTVPSRDKAPGQRECDYSIDGINRCIRDIEQASLAAVSQSLATRDDISVEVRRVSGRSSEVAEESQHQILGGRRSGQSISDAGVLPLENLPTWEAFRRDRADVGTAGGENLPSVSGSRMLVM